ncbi:MAG TPA: hypothetical protein VE172_14405 [Stackebrandtia sp.]|jgi:hypothetical protein|uniref:hypothetical protein n=1 Tax=Stackebrandtia sp. TaxID=2023065 RepID=UPI002D3F5BA7|nr:hypothetical protein [Stackebrandtia sp.]HZE39994.1 hypothetical protein [Stackebrandtia sp.]
MWKWGAKPLLVAAVVLAVVAGLAAWWWTRPPLRVSPQELGMSLSVPAVAAETDDSVTLDDTARRGVTVDPVITNHTGWALPDATVTLSMSSASWKWAGFDYNVDACAVDRPEQESSRKACQADYRRQLQVARDGRSATIAKVLASGRHRFGSGLYLVAKDPASSPKALANVANHQRESTVEIRATLTVGGATVTTQARVPVLPNRLARTISTDLPATVTTDGDGPLDTDFSVVLGDDFGGRADRAVVKLTGDGLAPAAGQDCRHRARGAAGLTCTITVRRGWPVMLRFHAHADGDPSRLKARGFGASVWVYAYSHGRPLRDGPNAEAELRARVKVTR